MHGGIMSTETNNLQTGVGLPNQIVSGRKKTMMNEFEIKKQICDTGKRIYDRNGGFYYGT